MPRRVRRPADFKKLFGQLTDPDDYGIFKTYKDVIIFAAAIGAHHEKKKEFKDTDDPIDYGIFSRRVDNEALIYLLSIFHQNNKEILSDSAEDNRVLILEEYAYAGLEIIEDRIKHSATVLDAFINLILESYENEEHEDDEIANILDSLKSK